MAGLSLRKSGFDSRSFHCRLIADKVALWKDFFPPVLRFSPVSIIPPTPYIHSCISHPEDGGIRFPRNVGITTRRQDCKHHVGLSVTTTARSPEGGWWLRVRGTDPRNFGEVGDGSILLQDSVRLYLHPSLVFRIPSSLRHKQPPLKQLWTQ